MKLFSLLFFALTVLPPSPRRELMSSSSSSQFLFLHPNSVSVCVLSILSTCCCCGRYSTAPFKKCFLVFRVSLPSAAVPFYDDDGATPFFATGHGFVPCCRNRFVRRRLSSLKVTSGPLFIELSVAAVAVAKSGAMGLRGVLVYLSFSIVLIRFTATAFLFN